jgi:ABC-type sugar transport system, periplasmic component
MKNAKRRLWIWLLAAALIVAAIVTGGLFRAKTLKEAAKPITLTLALDVSDPKLLESLGIVLNNFSTLYPRIQVRVETLTVRASLTEAERIKADVVVRTGPELQGESIFNEPARPWTGKLWVLAARKDYLDAAASRQKDAVAALRSGKATGAQFELLLEDAAKNGLSPITLGNDYSWPFLLWLQHWTAATKGPQTVAILPPLRGQAAASGNSEDPYAAIRPAFADLMRWKKNGWFDKTAWAQGWSQGYAPLDKGEAAFALISAERLSAISPRGRASLEYLPFPRRLQDEDWSIGAASYIGVAKGSHEPEAARLLVKFLSSPGITSRLAELTAQPFFSWAASSGASPTVLADWSNAAMSPSYAGLAEEFNPGE